MASDNKTCADRDECTLWGYCDQLCTNTPGSYSCSCAPGYSLKNNNRCVADDYGSMQLYFAHDKSIFVLNPSGSNVKVVVNTTGASGLDFHYNRNILYWSDVKTKRVSRKNVVGNGLLNGSDFQIHSQPLKNAAGFSQIEREIALPGTWLPVAIAVDWVGDKLYVADAIGQKIDLFELVPALGKPRHAIVLSSNLTNPADIALDPSVGLMFIADSSQVLRANMDGTNSLAIVSEAAYKASGITVDIIAKRVFWCDSLLDYIETVDYDGRKRYVSLVLYDRQS